MKLEKEKELEFLSDLLEKEKGEFGEIISDQELLDDC